jgi:hypothetical protein
MGETVWVRPYRDQVVIVHVGDDGPVEVARHARTTPGNPRVADALHARKLLPRNGFWPSVTGRGCG